MPVINSISILSKLNDLTLEDHEFQNPDTKEVIKYKRVTATVVVDGEETRVELIPAKAEGKGAYNTLRLAEEQ